MRTLLRLAAIPFALATCAHASAAATLDTCNDDGYQQVLQAAPNGIEAHAVWLNEQLLRWPGANANGANKL